MNGGCFGFIRFFFGSLRCFRDWTRNWERHKVSSAPFASASGKIHLLDLAPIPLSRVHVFALATRNKKMCSDWLI
jgi:hypothetical protein